MKQNGVTRIYGFRMIGLFFNRLRIIIGIRVFSYSDFVIGEIGEDEIEECEKQECFVDISNESEVHCNVLFEK